MINSVYLCGPIYNKGYEEATNWRDHAANELKCLGVSSLDPLRSRRFLTGVGKIEHSHAANALTTPKAITVRDRFDCTRASVVLANLSWSPGDDVSIGSIMEIAWADAMRIPIVAILTEGSPYSTHPMLGECIGIVAKDLDEAIALTVKVLK